MGLEHQRPAGANDQFPAKTWKESTFAKDIRADEDSSDSKGLELQDGGRVGRKTPGGSTGGKPGRKNPIGGGAGGSGGVGGSGGGGGAGGSGSASAALVVV